MPKSKNHQQQQQQQHHQQLLLQLQQQLLLLNQNPNLHMNNGIDWSSDGLELYLSPLATVSTITPSNGRSGTKINVYGHHFVHTETLSCSFTLLNRIPKI